MSKKEDWQRKTTDPKQGKVSTDPIIVESVMREEDIVKITKNLASDKAGPSGTKDKMDLVQHNPFDALLSKEADVDPHKQARRESDMMLEREVNNDLAGQSCNNEDDTSTQDSEFVDATQQINRSDDNNSMENEESDDANEVNDKNTTKIAAADVEKPNRKFLNQSWANMQQNEEVEIRLLKQLEIDHPQPNEVPTCSDGFQFVTGSKRKNSKKEKTTVRSSYSTRATAVNPKPFR